MGIFEDIEGKGGKRYNKQTLGRLFKVKNDQICRKKSKSNILRKSQMQFGL